MFAIYLKELKSYFYSLFGWIYVSLFLLFMGIYSMVYNFKFNNIADISYTLSGMVMILMLATPILTMKIISEERQKKTDQLIYSLPISSFSAVFAKYAAMVTVFILPMCVVCVYPPVINMFGVVNFKSAYGCILAFFLLGATLLAIGLFISSLFDSIVVTAIVSLIVMLILYFSSSLVQFIPSDALSSFIALSVVVVAIGVVLYLLTKNILAALATSTVLELVLAVFYKFMTAEFEGLFGKMFKWFSVFDRYNNFLNGIFDLTSVIYFVSVTALFIFLTVQAFEKRRWS